MWDNISGAFGWQHIDCGTCVDLEYELLPVYEHSTLRICAPFSWCQWMHPGVTIVVFFFRPVFVTYIVHTSLVLVSRQMICVAPFHALPSKLSFIAGFPYAGHISFSGAWRLPQYRHSRLSKRPWFTTCTCSHASSSTTDLCDMADSAALQTSDHASRESLRTVLCLRWSYLLSSSLRIDDRSCKFLPTRVDRHGNLRNFLHPAAFGHWTVQMFRLPPL